MGSGDRHQGDVKRLQDLFGAVQPKETRGYLFVPDPSVAYIRGSTVRSLVPRHVALSNGVLVPLGARVGPAPIDFMRTYVTTQELLGRRVGFEAALRWLGRFERGSVLVAVATLLAVRQAVDADWVEHDRELASRLFSEPTRTKALNLLRERRVLVSPQALLIAAKAALQISPTDGDGDLSLFVPAVMAIQEDLISVGEDADDKNSPGGRLFREIVRSQAFHLETYERALLTTFQLRWRDLPPTMPDPRVDLATEFEAATGVPLDDLSVVGVALWSRAVQQPGEPIPTTWFSSLEWEPDRLDRVLGLIARDASELGELVEKDEEELGFGWSFDRLRQFPVVRLEDGRLLVISPRLLIERTFGWLPIFDLRQGWMERGDEGRGRRALQFFEDVCERQVLDSLEAIAGSGPGPRVYDDDAIRAAFGRRSKVADAVFDAGEALVAVEVSTRQLQRRVRGSDSEEDLATDLERGIYRKVEQLDATISGLREDESRLTAIRTPSPRRIVPVLVVTEGFPVNPMTTAAIEREVAARGLLRQVFVAPLRIIDQEELDMIESLVESGDASLLQLLDEWNASPLRAMDLRTFLAASRYQSGTPARLAPAFELSWRAAMDALGADDDHAEDHDGGESAG